MNNKNKIRLNWPVGIVAWVLLLLIGVLSVTPLIPPQAPLELGTSDFSVTKAFEHIERIAKEPRPIGSLANLKARTYIVTSLKKLGLETDVQIINVPDYYGAPGEMVEIANVVARIPGTAPTTALAISGHYDTFPGTPGANDDASAVAIMLEVARDILAGDPLRNDLILVFFDCEEPAPRYGSSGFMEEHAWANEVGFDINLETIGSGGQSTLIGLSGPGGWPIDQYINAVPNPAAFSFLTTTADMIGGSNSDFASFKEYGIPGFEFAYLRGSTIYHTASDSLENVSLRSLQQQGANTLALARYIGDLDFSSIQDTPGAIFFNIGNSNVIKYPDTWALPIALLSGVVLIAVGLRQKAWLKILRSFVLSIVVMLVSALVGAGIWIVLAGQRSMMGIAESYSYLAGLLVLTIGISIAVARLTRRRFGEMSDATGVVIVWWVLGLLTSLYAAGMSYLFVWPALAGGVILLWRTFPIANRQWQPIMSVPVLGCALILMLPAIDTFYMLVQPRPGNPDSQIFAVVAIPLVMLALMIELFRVFWVKQVRGLNHQYK